VSRIHLKKNDRLGLAHPALDAHTLGIMSVAQLLEHCGYCCIPADAATCAYFDTPDNPVSLDGIARWIRDQRITVLGFSYRLDPDQGLDLAGRLVEGLSKRRLLHRQGGRLRALCFAGLPATCEKVRRHVPEVLAVFDGDETASETFQIMGIPDRDLPNNVRSGITYDEDRLAFARDLVRACDYTAVHPPDPGPYPDFGTQRDTLTARIEHCRRHHALPLVRAHAGPYLPDRDEAVRLFLSWTRQLAAAGHLDILSIGTSQLTQSRFGEDWGNQPNGGGVPINSPEEFAAVWEAARPMLVRAYAGTKDLRGLAEMHEKTLHIAWHALSLWWFCRMDGRGPYTLSENLQQQFDALRYAASTGKPYEPNVAHHFAFRGADDATSVVSAVLAARAAKSLGIRHLVLQNMLNTPKGTWGIQDLAKARALLCLVRELEDDAFRVIYQPRAGLDSFSPDPEKAKAQLAAATALMDDVEPRDPDSPSVIHVVSYTEGSRLADPPVINESIQITRCALRKYRQLRKAGQIDDMSDHLEVKARTEDLLAESREILGAMEAAIPNLYSPIGLYQAFAAGFLPVPYLWQCREEFPAATPWRTALVRGSVKVVNERGTPLPVTDRIRQATQTRNGKPSPKKKGG
jgi:hypothetical protein